MSKLFAAALAVASLAVVAVPAGAAESTGRLVVLVERPALPVGKDAEARSARDRAFRAARARIDSALRGIASDRVERSLPALGAAVIDPPSGETVTALRARLMRRPEVVAVEREHRLRFYATPNDPAYGAADPNAPASAAVQWNLQRQGFPAAWDHADGAGVLVGVVDSGIDGRHPDFSEKIEAAVDRDTNPVHGPGDVDENGHGTHVSGLACAGTGNGYGIAASGNGCRIIMQKTDLSDSSVADSIRDATDRGAKVINLSLGGDTESLLLARAVDYAWARDVVLVAAAANDEVQDQGQPASLIQPTGTGPDLNAGRGLVVTAAEYDDTRADFAGLGTQISLAAYGHASDTTAGIFSTFPGETTEMDTGSAVPPDAPCFCRANFHGDNRFAYLSGTSMATPQVAGAVALVRGLNPRLAAPEVIRMVKESARRSGGYGNELGWGILDAGTAVEAARRADRKPPQTRVKTTSRVRSRWYTIRLFGSDKRDGAVLPSGIKRFDVYMAKDRSKKFRRIKRTSKRRFKVKGMRGHRYRFYSRAVDNSGNVESVPRRVDSSTRIIRRSGRK